MSAQKERTNYAKMPDEELESLAMDGNQRAQFHMGKRCAEKSEGLKGLEKTQSMAYATMWLRMAYDNIGEAYSPERKATNNSRITEQARVLLGDMYWQQAQMHREDTPGDADPHYTLFGKTFLRKGIEIGDTKIQNHVASLFLRGNLMQMEEKIRRPEENRALALSLLLANVQKNDADALTQLAICAEETKALDIKAAYGQALALSSYGDDSEHAQFSRHKGFQIIQDVANDANDEDGYHLAIVALGNLQRFANDQAGAKATEKKKPASLQGNFSSKSATAAGHHDTAFVTLIANTRARISGEQPGVHAAMTR